MEPSLPSQTETNPECDAQPPFGLVAIDLDGTLLRSDKQVSPRVMEAVAAARRRGVHVVLASARPPRGLLAFCQLLELMGTHIHYNGALIVDVTRQEHVYHRPLEPALAQEVVAFARWVQPDVVVNVEVLDRWFTDRVDDSLQVETSRLAPPDHVGPLDTCLTQPVTKLMFLAPPPAATAVRHAVQSHFAHRIAMATSDHHVVQVLDREVSKAQAVQWMASRHGIEAHRVMAIGDAPNDVEMIRWAGLGVAVENAWHDATEAADVTVASNDDDGVAQALEQYVLG